MTKEREKFAAWTAYIAATVFLSVFLGGFSYTSLCAIAGLPGSLANNTLAGLVAAPAGFLTGLVLALAVHEFAHALTVHLVGGHIYGIIIGKGPLVAHFPVMGTTCYIHASLLGGAVRYGLSSSERLRRKFALVTASAPVASVILCAACSGMLAMLFQHCAELPGEFIGFAIGLTASTYIYLPGTLLPFTLTFHGRRLKTDALKLLSIPWMTDEEIAKHVMLNRPLIEARELADLSINSLDKALAFCAAEPSNTKAIFTAGQFLRDAHDPRSMTYFRKLLDFPAPPAARRIYIDCYLTACLDFDSIRGNALADQLSRELLASNPDDLSLQGTRGSVLIDLGSVTEGKAMLKAILAKTDHPVIKVYANLFLALAERGEGNLGLARDYAQKATEDGVVVEGSKRVADLLEAADRPS